MLKRILGPAHPVSYLSPFLIKPRYHFWLICTGFLKEFWQYLRFLNIFAKTLFNSQKLC
ncbi:MAG: hypothetical protein HDT33_01380 [Clostridiales bacterium]|nr:hypothetical protein [Clostridiales bacterium]